MFCVLDTTTTSEVVTPSSRRRPAQKSAKSTGALIEVEVEAEKVSRI